MPFSAYHTHFQFITFLLITQQLKTFTSLSYFICWQFLLSRCRNYFIMLILQCPALSSPFFPSLPSHPLPFLLSYILQLSLSLFSFSLPYSLFISIISIPISISSFNKYFLGTYFCHHYSETKGTSVRGQGEQLLSHTLSTDERHLKVITTLLGSPLAIYY